MPPLPDPQFTPVDEMAPAVANKHPLNPEMFTVPVKLGDARGALRARSLDRFTTSASTGCAEARLCAEGIKAIKAVSGAGAEKARAQQRLYSQGWTIPRSKYVCGSTNGKIHVVQDSNGRLHFLSPTGFLTRTVAAHETAGMPQLFLLSHSGKWLLIGGSTETHVLEYSSSRDQYLPNSTISTGAGVVVHALDDQGRVYGDFPADVEGEPLPTLVRLEQTEQRRMLRAVSPNGDYMISCPYFMFGARHQYKITYTDANQAELQYDGDMRYLTMSDNGREIELGVNSADGYSVTRLQLPSMKVMTQFVIPIKGKLRSSALEAFGPSGNWMVYAVSEGSHMFGGTSTVGLLFNEIH